MKRKQISIIGIVVVLIISVISYFLINNRLSKVSNLNNNIEFQEYKIAKLSEGWSLIAKGDLEIGWLYKLNGSSVTLTVTEKLPKEKYTEKAFEIGLINQYLKLNLENELIDNQKKELWGTIFNVIRIKFNNPKYGLTEVILFYKWVNKQCYWGTISFPYSKDKIISNSTPKYIKSMINCISINKNSELFKKKTIY